MAILRWSFIIFFCFGVFNVQAEEIIHASALSMGSAPKYNSSFSNFDYVNPEAPKGGIFHTASIGTFNTFNPIIDKGELPSNINLIYDSLMVASTDEPYARYGLIAKSVDYPATGGWIIFNLRSEARFNDGVPLTAEDVVFSFNIQKEKGSPGFQQYYRDVEKVEALDKHTVKFYFKNKENRELPLIVSELVILPKHFWKDKNIDKVDLEIPLGSGPYKISKFKPGQSFELVRVKNYWAKDLPTRKGYFNFDKIVGDYYRDSDVALEAFKAGEYDYRYENAMKNWETAYDIPALKQGLIVKKKVENQIPQGMQGFFMNLRKPLFKNKLVREALLYAYDFEWENKHFYYNAYKRCNSFFSNSEFAATGLPSGNELKYLNEVRDELDPELFLQKPIIPVSDGLGFDRENLLKAQAILKTAGWVIKNNQLVNKVSGEVFKFELLLISPELQRIAIHFQQNLKKLGIDMQIRLVDTAQYISRLQNYDFDMIVYRYGQSLYPGNEQLFFWHSSAADVPNTSNLAGLKDLAVDKLVENIAQAKDRSDLISRVKALDRALLWKFIVIPQFYGDVTLNAYWDRFGQPKIKAKYFAGIDWLACWIDSQKSARVDKFLNKLEK